MRGRSVFLFLVIIGFFPQTQAEARSLDLPTAIERALDHAWSLKSEDSLRREAEARRDKAVAMALPKLTFEGTYARLSSDVNASVGKQLGAQKVPDTVGSLSAVVTQPLTAIGHSYFLTRSQENEMRRLDAEKERETLAVALATSEAFVTAYKAQKMVDVANVSVRLAETQLQNVKAKERVGKATPADSLRLSMSLAEAQVQLSQAQARSEVARKALLTLIGDNAETDLAIDFTAVHTPPMAQTDDFAEARASRPEFRQFGAAKEGIEYLMASQRIDRLPNVNLFAKYDRNLVQEDIDIPGGHAHAPGNTGQVMQIPGTHFDKSDVRDNLSFGVNFKWTIFDGGLRSAERIETAEKEVRIAYDEGRFTEGLRLELSQVSREIDHLEAALRFSQTTQETAEESYRQQQARFQNGVATVTDLVAAERDLTRARNLVVTAEADLQLAKIKKTFLIGKTPSTQKRGA